MDDLTKDTSKLLCVLYKKFLEFRKEGKSKEDARRFGDSSEIWHNYFPDELVEDITAACWELHKAGYAVCQRGDNLANNVTLTDTTIIYMENRFKNGLADVMLFLSNFIP